MPHKDREAGNAYRRSWNAAHRPGANAYARKHRKENPDYYRVQDAATRANAAARRAGVPGRLTMDDVRRAWSAPACAYCGGDGIGLDHAVPLSRGGPNDPTNIVRCCPSCNHRKGDRTPDEWAASRQARTDSDP